MINQVGANNSNNYKITELDRFKRSIGSFKKAHYKKNPLGEKEFNLEIEKYIESLKSGNFHDSDLQSFPGNTAQTEYQFRKKRWKSLPRLDGSSRYGRLLFLIYYPKKLIYLCWFYSHEEFKKQPPDQELISLIEEAKRDTIDP